MDAFIELKSLQLSQDITIRAEWPTQERFLTTKGQILFGKYIIVPANGIVFLDEKNNQQVVASRYIIGGKNIQKPFPLDIENGASTYVNVYKDDLLGCIQFAETRIQNQQIFKGIIRFLNLAELFSMQKQFDLNISAIVPQSQIIERNPSQGQKKKEISLNELSSVLSSKIQSSIDFQSNILDQLNLLDEQEKKPMITNFGKNKQIKLEKSLKNLSAALKLPKTQFSWHQNTPYAEKFLIEGKQVSRISEWDDQYYQITSQQTIPKNVITDITFQLHQYGGTYSIIFGIITKSSKNIQYSDGGSQQEVGYITNPNRNAGCIWIDGNKIQNYIEDAFVEANGTLLMKVDTIKYQLTFVNSSNPKNEFTYQLEEHNWKNKNIYVYVTMRYKGDSVSILC